MTLVTRVNNNLPSLMENFFGRDFSDLLAPVLNSNQVGVSIPAVNVAEGKEDFRIEVAAPGLRKEDFKINVDHNRLTISSETETSGEPTHERYTRREFSYRSFQRTFTLPQTVDADKINAAYADGVLHISLPKREEAKVKPARTVEIG